MRFQPYSASSEQPVEGVLEVKDVTLTTDQEALMHAPKVIALAQQFDVTDDQAIVSFGEQSASQIATFADRILTVVKSSALQDSNKMLQKLTLLMKKFDIDELKNHHEGLFEKLIGGGKSAIEKLLSKYQSLGHELDDIVKEINLYKNECNRNNETLEALFQENLQYYQALNEYIAAAKLVIQEIEAEDVPVFEEKAKSGDPVDLIALDQVKNKIELLQRRVYDLEMAKVVSMQTAPQIRTIQKGNYNLIMKIHSAFIVTIPAFKIGLIQAVTLKQQENTAKGLAGLDQATEEILTRNAQRSVKQSVEIAKMATNPSISVSTVEQNWRTIVAGIDEVSRIESEAAKSREEGLKQLASLQTEFKQKMISLSSQRTTQ